MVTNESLPELPSKNILRLGTSKFNPEFIEGALHAQIVVICVEAAAWHWILVFG